MAVMFGAGSVALVLISGQSSARPLIHASVISTSDQLLLVDARQSLLSYTALYPWLYGPRGAGTGHLPCPDTDVQQMPTHQGVDQWATLDGPNPPCGNLIHAVGKLPRHVRLSDQRYAFHAEPMQLASFQVSGLVINNPVNRVVNPGLPGLSESTEPAAFIALPAKTPRQLNPRSVISYQALVEAAQPSVAAWVAGRSRNLPKNWCNGATADEQSSSSSSADIASVNALYCQRFIELAARCPDDQAMLLALDHLPDTELCATDVLAQLSMQGVPASRHWFVRNLWSEWFAFDSDKLCSDETAAEAPCHLVLNRPEPIPDDSAEHTGADLAKAINMYWTR